jgi:hypothetical protein
MTDLMGFMGQLQDNGGILVALVLLVWEMRRLRSDFASHVHDDTGAPIIRVAK